ITCHWVSNEFHIYKLTLDIIEMGAYKTANDIIDSIKPILEEFARLSILDPIANIFCAMHILQLSVKAGLEIARNLLTKYKALISFLSEEKKEKRKQLREAQIRVGILKAHIVDIITDVPTWWNFTYMALERLANLERPIKC
ncbi:45013_t:CDS:2, partial [Gigaspora margarita]